MNMKKWNEPEVSELNINETANGKFDFLWEGKFINNDLLEAIEDAFKCPKDDPTNQTS